MFSQLVNQTLDRYKILNLLGEGGMGAVFKAFDLTLQREVAVKVMHPNFASQQDFQDRFLQEARTAARMDHPSIVQVYDFGQTQGLLYIVMEFIPGDNLAKMLKDLKAGGKWILLPETVHLISQVALALEYAHNHGVLHRDIKPGNIMIEPIASDGLPYRPVLTDLGLAKLIGGGMQTMDGTSMGTPSYMSPEQAIGTQTDGRSDIYSLGVLLFELATGRLPFPVRNLIEAIQYHTKEPPPLPRSINPDLPANLEAVVLRTLEKDPGQRYQNAAEFAQALTDLLPELKLDTSEPTVLAAQVSLLTQYEQSLVEVRGASVLEEFEPVSKLTQDSIQVMTGGKTIQNVPIKPTGLTIGRDVDDGICLEDSAISRRHARVEVVGDTYRILDLGSTNGTFLGNARLLPGVAEEWVSDRPLRIGKFWLRLVRADEGSRTAVNRLDGGTLVDDGRLRTSTGQGRIGVFLEEEQLAVEPGKSVDFKLILLNQSQLVDQFKVAIQGISVRWLPSSLKPVNLMPGDQHEILLSIHPPRVPKSRAGRYPITINVTSEQAPDESVDVKATLTVAAFAEFKSEMHPQRIRSEKPARVRVSNLGNLPEAYTLALRDQADELRFNPPQIQIRIPEGQTALTEFSAVPRQFRLLGGDRLHPFQLQITTSKGITQAHTAELASKGLIPIWLLSLFLLMCLGLTGISALLVGSVASRAGRFTQTLQAGQTAIAQAVDTTNIVASATASALQTQGVAAIQAATATEAWLVQDDDRDGLDNRTELQLGSLGNVRDTDEDGLSDGEEVQRKTNPLDDDSDNDGLKDGLEVIQGSDPLLVDTDSDGIPDNRDDAPSASSTVPPTATQPSPTIPATPTATTQPSPTPTPTPTSTRIVTPTASITPTKTLPPSSYTNFPPLIDGFVTSGEWDKAFQAFVMPNGVVYYQNDSQYLYVLMDIVNDTFDDPPLSGSPWGDYFWLAFDVNENGIIDASQDLTYGLYPGSYSMGITYYLGSGTFTGVQPTGSFMGVSFNKSHKSATNHRIWEFALLLSEIQALPGQDVAIGALANSQNPSFMDRTPADIFTSVASFIKVHLDLP